MSNVILGIDPGLANTGWGIISKSSRSLECIAYGCVTTPSALDLTKRLHKIYTQISAVIKRFDPDSIGIESVLFGNNVTAAFKTGQARGAALVACAEHNLVLGEFTPSQIKASVTGVGNADKHQVQYMVKTMLSLDEIPKPDHSSDALAAAICFVANERAMVC